MQQASLSFKEANQNLLWIILVGIGIGIANYAMGHWPNLGQSLVQHVLISLFIGYFLLVICENGLLRLKAAQPDILEYLVLSLLFALVGFIGSEVEPLVRSLVFNQGEYQFFSVPGTNYFNTVISIILGFTFLNLTRLKQAKQETEEMSKEEETENLKDFLQAIPIKQGEAIALHNVEDILYFEAYDNYSFLYDTKGNKLLCNYSLSFLENRLGEVFLRVHRKYIINTSHIHLIKPHLKGRYVIEFKDQKRSTITSSASYTEAIKALIKL